MEFDWEFVDRIVELLKPEPPTKQELDEAAAISVADFAIYSEKLGLICEEAKEIFVRAGRTGMLLAGDLVVGLYTAPGDMVTALCGAYIHAVTGGPPIKYIMRRWKDDPTVGVKEGDFFFNNDALFGSLHSPDEAILMPIFYEGELIAWSGAAVQETEVGCGPGPGMPIMCRSRFDEGLKSPPLKVGENFQLRQDVVTLLGNMTRTPQMHETDMRARATACDRVRIRIEQLCREKGVSFVRGLMHRMIIETEKRARDRIRGWNDGKYRSVVFYDMIGYRETLTRVSLAVTKKGDTCLLDFSGSSPETDGAMNNFAHAAVAHVIHQLYCGPFADLVPSSGIFGALEFKFEPNTVLHASKWASTVLSPPYLRTVMWTSQICFSKMMFARPEERPLVMAPPGAGGSINFGGVNQWGVAIADLHTVLLNEFGGGARSERDGVKSMFFTHCPWGKANDIEEIEIETPWLHLYCRHAIDQGGFGKQRGGCGVTLSCMGYHTPWIGWGRTGVSSRFPLTPGLFGGYPPATMATVTITRSNALEAMRNGDLKLPRNTVEMIEERSIGGKYTFESIQAPARAFERGDILAYTIGAGGGYGDVLERDPQLVMQDLKEQLISGWTAENVYKVSYDPTTLEIDVKRTEELRGQEREARKARGKNYDEFEKEWLKQRPPEEAVEFFGSWPEGRPTRTIVRI